MSAAPKRKPSKRLPASRRLETRSSGPTAMEARAGRDLQLPHERDEAAVHEPRKMVARNRGHIRRAARDVDQGLVDTEARGTPSNVPVARRSPAGKRVKRSAQ